MASNNAPWRPAPDVGSQAHSNGLAGDSEHPVSMTEDYRMVGKHGQVLAETPSPDPFCSYMDQPVPNAADPNVGDARGISPGPFAKG